jgi:hypothetical protein
MNHFFCRNYFVARDKNETSKELIFSSVHWTQKTLLIGAALKMKLLSQQYDSSHHNQQSSGDIKRSDGYKKRHSDSQIKCYLAFKNWTNSTTRTPYDGEEQKQKFQTTRKKSAPTMMSY